MICFVTFCKFTGDWQDVLGVKDKGCIYSSGMFIKGKPNWERLQEKYMALKMTTLSFSLTNVPFFFSLVAHFLNFSLNH